MSIWPSRWVCQAVRAVGSNVPFRVLLMVSMTERLADCSASLPACTLAGRVPGRQILRNSCLIAQGSKRVMLGEDAYVYDADHYLVTSVDLPVVAQIVEASREEPFLGVIMELDLSVIAQLMVETELPASPMREVGRGIAVSELPLTLAGAFVRLIDLLEEPENVPALAPLVQR